MSAGMDWEYEKNFIRFGVIPLYRAGIINTGFSCVNGMCRGESRVL
jgi:hypothetical protein